MKKKLTFIFILITFSMLGIIYFQIDWVYKTYNANLKKISADADAALIKALKIYHADQNESIIKQLKPYFSDLYDNVSIRRTKDLDSLIIELQENSKPLKSDTNMTAQLTTGPGRLKVFFPSRKIIKGEVVYEPKDLEVNKTIDKLFPHKENCMPLYYKIDSGKILKCLTGALLEAGIINLDEKLRLKFFCSNDAPSHLQHFLRPQTHTSLPSFNAYEYQPSELSHYGSHDRRWVKAQFYFNPVIVFSKMFGSIILSVVSILITTGSFIYLLKIILKQKRLAEMKDDFINNMTHELKTPIAIISAAVEGMQNFNALQDKEKTNRYLETSRKELNRLNDLVTKVLHMASYEKKDIQLSLEKIEVDELMNDIIESFKNHSDKALNITYKNASSVKYLEADPVHFRNAISNLIDNAIKYSGDQVDISINCYTEGEYVNISIADKSIGIPANQLSQIFEKFHRVPTGNIHNVKGTGLGLSYVKYIIEKHGGTVSVKSELNKGSEFIISVPSNS